MTLPQRSERLLDRKSSMLLVIDLQTKLLPLVGSHETVAWNAERLLAGANSMLVPHLVTEQYPEKLGETIALADTPLKALSKRMFSCRECAASLAEHRRVGIRQVVICGIETHVCVLQTALDLVNDGWQVHVVVDAVGSRSRVDHETAIARMMGESVVVTTTESVVFEWCETSTAPEFRAISSLVRQPNPAGQ